MSRARLIAWTLLAAGGFALLAPPAAAQPALPQKKSDATSAVTTWRDTPRGGIPKEELKAAKEHFAKFAQYYAEVVAHPAVWKATQDFKIEAPGAVKPPTIDGPNGILVELDRYLIEPVPNSGKPNTEPGDYIRELGAALDAALKNMIETHPELIVRINAARVLSHVTKTGAPAHFATLTALLSNPTTHPAVKNYLYVAAGAALSANDPYDIKIRKHAVEPKAVGALVKVLDDSVNSPALLVPGLPAGNLEEVAPDQVAVLGAVRRQAVRALAKTKFASLPGPDGKTKIYPAATLARVALRDPAFVPAPGPAESIEAVLGLLNMAPVEEKGGRFIADKAYNPDVALEAILSGLVTFAAPRAANPFDRTLPWRTYALQTADALQNWRRLFDPEYDIMQPTKFDAKAVPAAIEAMYKEVVPSVLAPMDKLDLSGKPDATVTVKIQELKARLAETKARPNRNTLMFKGVEKTSIEPAKK